MVDNQRLNDERQARREQRLEVDDLASQVDEQLLLEREDEVVDLEEDEQEVGNEELEDELVVHHNLPGDPRPNPPPLGDHLAEEPLLHRGERIVRGGDGEQVELADRLAPEVPGPLEGPVVLDGDGWRTIDLLGAWDCALNIFSSLEDVPYVHRVGWGRAMTKVLTSILSATNQEELDRALKWLLLMPSALLRKARRGGGNGRSGRTVSSCC